MKKISVIAGDIAQVEADALITAINPGGSWWGGIDGVIQRAAGGYFHAQAAASRPLTDGKAIVATGPGGTLLEAAQGITNKGKFKNVVFVVDALELPLIEIVLNALTAADNAGYKTVSLPTVRMGVMAGVVESREEAIKALASVAKSFLKNAQNVETINIVVYNDEDTKQQLNEALRE